MNCHYRLFYHLFFPCRHFDAGDRQLPGEAAKLFSVPDFVGDACKAIASRVRGAVASVKFDDFHKVSFHGFQSSCQLPGTDPGFWKGGGVGVDDKLAVRSWQVCAPGGSEGMPPPRNF